MAAKKKKSMPARKRPPRPPCVAEGCIRPAIAQGYCSQHYEQWRRGSPKLPPDKMAAVAK